MLWRCWSLRFSPIRPTALTWRQAISISFLTSRGISRGLISPQMMKWSKLWRRGSNKELLNSSLTAIWVAFLQQRNYYLFCQTECSCNWHAQLTICVELIVVNKNYGSTQRESYRTVRVKMKSFSVFSTCLRKCVNLNNSFVSHCVKIHRVIEFYYTGLAKTSKKKIRGQFDLWL